MAVVVSNQVTKAKLVFQLEDASGEARQSSRTFSNLVAGLSNEALYAGMTALAGLMDVTVKNVKRVDEDELKSE